MNNELNISNVVHLLTNQYHCQLAILFGSVASGTAHSQSDVDLAVLLPTEVDAATKLSLVDELSAVVGRGVDLVDLRVAGEPLLGEILVNGTRLLGSDEVYGDMISKHLIESADFLPYRERILKERRDAWLMS